MRLFAAVLSVALFFGGLIPTIASADELSDHKVTMTGVIVRPSATVMGKAETLTLTTKNLLALFGVLNVKPNAVTYVFNKTAGSYVLMSKDKLTTYGTILTFSQVDGVSFDVSGAPYSPNYTSFHGGSAITMLNGALKGSAFYGVFAKGAKASEPATFVAYGTFSNVVTLIKGSLLESGNTPP